MRKHLISTGALALMAALPLSSQAADCMLRVTTWGGSYQATYEKVAAEFEKKENCKVQWVVGSSADHLVKTRLGQVDVTTNTLLNSIAGEKEGLWLKLDPAKIPNMKNLYPNANYSPYTVFANVGDYVLAYNSDKIKTAPTSWDVLWDPKYKHHEVIYGFDNIPTLSLAVMQAEKNGGGIDNIEPGLKKIAELYNSGNLIGALDVESQMVSLFETNDAWLGMMATGRIKELWEKGATQVKVSRPKEGTFPLISSMNIPKKSKNPEMSMKFVNYVLSTPWQEAFAVRNIYAPTVTNAKIPADFKYKDLLVQDKDFERLYLPDQTKISKNRSKWRDQLDQMTTR